MIQTVFKKAVLSAYTCIIVFSCFAQSNVVQEINQINTAKVALAPLRFLASDELMGRSTTRPEINIAARYISEEFKSLGLKECPGITDYFQIFSIKMKTPSQTGTLTVNNQTYHMGGDIVQMSGEDMDVNAPIVYAGMGSKEDLDKTDVKGKIVVTDRVNSSTITLVQEHGGIALIQRFKQATRPWDMVKQYFVNERVEREEESKLPLFLINDTAARLPDLIQNKTVNAAISITGTQLRMAPAKNVMGWIEGTDATLKNQFVVLSAHYDHLGVAKKPRMEEGKMDSIYNGARDNAIGTTAVIDAARYFAQHPAKRSILFITFTAEEMGLIGSKYFAQHPALPLKQLVYDLNIDNASYNDTTIITFVGLGRTSADVDVKRACAAYNLSVLPDPTTEQWLFDGSDNVSLAAKGIPAPTFSLWMRTFDSTIFNRYHQLSDEVGNFNLNYAMKFINSFVLAAKYIADGNKQPTWVKGDKYEAAWKQLYH